MGCTRKKVLNNAIEKNNEGEKNISCDNIEGYNRSVPKVAIFREMSEYYKKIDDKQFANKMEIMSITEFITYLRQNSKEDSYVQKEDLKIIRDYTKQFICCKSCKNEDYETADQYQDCYNRYIKKLKRLEKDALENIPGNVAHERFGM